MIHRLRSPRYPLNLFIDNLWFYQGYCPDHDKEKFLPDGAVDVVIDLSSGPKRLYDNRDFRRYRTFKRSWISGQRKDYIVIQADRNSSMIGIRFRPGGAYPFLPFPMSELNDIVVQLDLIWGASINTLRERLLGATTADEKFDLIEGYLWERARGGLSHDALIAIALDRITRRPETLRVRDLADRIGVSQRHLIQQFAAKVGHKPKLVSRLFKFQKVLAEIEQRPQLHWTSLAQDCGYYDQAHFIHEFQKFSGMSPSHYLVERGQYLNYLPVKDVR